MIQMNDTDSPLRAIALMGATGTGKSSLAMSLAASTGTCIVACDSMQVYRQLDIGTAKPSASDQAQVRHALIDLMDLPAVFSAAAWALAAQQVILKENSAGRIPIICGGTGFYLRALLQGMADIPAVDESIRQRIMQHYQQSGSEAMHQALQKVDPVLAAQLDIGDSQRVVRALSVFEATAIPLSVWQQQQRHPVSLHCPVMVLQKPREQLRHDLAVRFHSMLDSGWLDEVKMLADTATDDGHPSMRAVGYRQLLEYLAGSCELETAINNGITATRRFAKRQTTWFRHQIPGAEAGSEKELKEYFFQCMN